MEDKFCSSSTFVQPPEPKVLVSIMDRLKYARFAAGWNTSQNPPTLVKISSADADRICRALMAIKFVLEHTSLLIGNIKKYKEINDLYRDRIDELAK
jgi:hypothetical protein